MSIFYYFVNIIMFYYIYSALDFCLFVLFFGVHYQLCKHAQKHVAADVVTLFPFQHFSNASALFMSVSY